MWQKWNKNSNEISLMWHGWHFSKYLSHLTKHSRFGHAKEIFLLVHAGTGPCIWVRQEKIWEMNIQLGFQWHSASSSFHQFDSIKKISRNQNRVHTNDQQASTNMNLLTISTKTHYKSQIEQEHNSFPNFIST